MKRIQKSKLNNLAQWYVVNTFSGNEDLAMENIKGKINAYNMESMIPDIRLPKVEVVTEIEVKREDAPKNIKDRKNLKWIVLPNGNYKKISTRMENKYPGYLFIKMVMSDEVWYVVRNTPGVTGFIGSSGKGTKPFPVTIIEILSVLGFNVNDKVRINEGENKDKIGTLEIDELTQDIIVKISERNRVEVQFYQLSQLEAAQQTIVAPEETEQKAIYKKPIPIRLNIGSIVKINSGVMKGMNGTVTLINEAKGTANIDIDFFGRTTQVEVDFEDVEI
jgi:NusG family protein